MPIGDLLASITGEKSEQALPSPTTATRPNDTIPKRKASEQLRGAPTKTPRTDPPANRHRPNDNSPRPLPPPTDRPDANHRDRPASSSQSSPAGPSSALKRPVPTASRDGRSTPSSASARPPPRPVVTRPADSDPAAKPKKRSFAEIMARAQANAPVRESFGKIQHKPIERSLTMRERKELKAEEARKLKKTGGKPQPVSKYTGTAAPARGTPGRPAPRPGAAAKGARVKTPPVEEKKVKKAALATTGYTGTARPRPGSTVSKPGAAARPGREAERERPRYAGYSRSRREEEEEFDDWIDYDEEDEPNGYGYGGRREYDSAEDESDMEAGLSDIDEEEQRAERVARQEDIKEMELEKRLKREKEEKKRQALAAIKAKAAAR
ncbi:hypothetical protein B0T16DRAFT_487087 [Cercophora newfieldiana]|uniref:SPT2 chromatin protein n=1 Tax=Cercophora newfieldiana TaxID=92897 RepID=A0AA39YN29_9PEZI|nr:hypothetical protein B0T16DRAFT_487087 [Cercophora newfieldiana]